MALTEQQIRQLTDEIVRELSGMIQKEAGEQPLQSGLSAGAPCPRRWLNTTIFVKNAPSVAGLGFGGEGCASMTIATPTGEGITSARTFTRYRRCVMFGDFRIC